jgi:hypothetical protein
MMRNLVILCAGGVLAGCATQPPLDFLPQVRAWQAAGGAAPPPISACPFVADIDLATIAADQLTESRRSSAARTETYLQDLLNRVRVTGDARAPSSEALVVLTGVAPPGGMYSNTVWSVVWKEPDGRWWFWRQNQTNEPPPPPPPPPGSDAGPAERAAYEAEIAQYPPPDHVRWPPVHGPLNAAQAAALERSLSDPCRSWEPDRWPWDPPLRRPRAQPGPPHPHDWTPFYVWIEEMGRPPRLITAPNERQSHVGAIHAIAAYPRS